MRIVDTNVLLYAVNSTSRRHVVARRWLDGALSGSEAVAIPWVCLLGFVRISTGRHWASSPLPLTVAMDIVDTWLARAVTLVPEPTRRHPALLRGLLEEAGTAGNLTTDAHIAALALEHGATVVSFDRDFLRFGVRLEVPY